ncbi:uncharacterized protein CG10915 isoform X2 [Belonocnema kinseyi]|uniref:uncharacterized protein CG10915 isoform X2 n=1 Tax=Belonocnema kinseyi TaxID=2817044 RepID=UPI00143D1A25|nr:uncharacterized protein CG10915 isoform X2 [Belonocnema kinseyi]
MASTSQAAVTASSAGSTIGPPGVSVSTIIPLAKSQTPPVAMSSQPQQPNQQGNNFEPLDKSSSNTLKRNPKMELSKTDLLKLLGYLEGELQARDIVIAALKSEKMKHLLSSRYRSGTSDPHSALARDLAIVGGTIGLQGCQADQQAASLEALIAQQRRMQCRMAKVLKEAEIRHRAVIKELEEEKRKHEHDTAQGDDITYGLEKERTRLKKELELEKADKKRVEQDMKKLSDTLDEEKSRQKQIVLLLLAERKKIIMKYIEERKRSEDLAQILSEEKVRIDSMAEGLEEESKKSLQMEAELEKQLAQFDIERQQCRQALAKEEKKAKDLEAELEKLKAEMETWKDTQARGLLRTVGVTPPPPPAKPANLAAMPTLRPATAPQTTGIARSVTPGQAIRGAAFTPSIPTSITETPAPTEAQAAHKRPVVPAPMNPAVPTKVVPASQTPGKLPVFSIGAAPVSPTPGILPAKKPPVSRGVPPPVPPNKPVVPPKKEAAYLRRTESSQLATDAVKFGKPIIPNATNIQAQQPIAVPTTHSTEEEVSNAI